MRLLLPLALLSLFSGAVEAQISTEGAAKITQQINALMGDFTDTLVTPTNLKDGVVVVSLKNLQSEKVAKMWMFLSACAVGKYLNDNPSQIVAEICFADAASLKKHPIKYMTVPADVAKRVQAKVHSGEMELEDGIAEISRNLKPKVVQPS